MRSFPHDRPITDGVPTDGPPRPRRTDMTLTERPAATFRMVSHDLYKDIHKAIRAELFAVTAQAGSSDPSDGTARAAIATRSEERRVGREWSGLCRRWW